MKSKIPIENTYCYCRLTMGFHFIQPLSNVTKVSLFPEYLLGCLDVIRPEERKIKCHCSILVMALTDNCFYNPQYKGTKKTARYSIDIQDAKQEATYQLHLSENINDNLKQFCCKRL